MTFNCPYLAVLLLLNAALLGGQVQAQSAAPSAELQAEKPAKVPSPIRIVCTSAIPASNSPLFVVDGKVVSEQDTKLLNPADIDKVDVLKSTAATALYGSRGTSGAVLITLKHRGGKYLHQPEAKKDHLD